MVVKESPLLIFVNVVFTDVADVTQWNKRRMDIIIRINGVLISDIDIILTRGLVHLLGRKNKTFRARTATVKVMDGPTELCISVDDHRFVFLTIVNDAVRDVFSIRKEPLPGEINRTGQGAVREEIHLGVEAHFLPDSDAFTHQFLDKLFFSLQPPSVVFRQPFGRRIKGDHINLESDVLHGFEHIGEIL